MQKEGKRADVTLVSGSLTLLGGRVGANTSSPLVLGHEGLECEDLRKVRADLNSSYDAIVKRRAGEPKLRCSPAP
jgi:hypothetical protein